ncbi:helix-turn-helix transcriptional regulator [Streptomyces sp. A1136]|uniref:helix-turn-helix domain-containing protein n=1 Tax=Streptomyces sp. A1136 TaxID=2563102 RepID=UPI00109E7D2B|nr:helix-turn-helix transcriptional regulator [Streptomyces sp. A1136]THA50830.1 XRE family transcriptional regulator [Streptomyces sp. A1136]
MNHPRKRRRKGAPFNHAPEAVTYAREKAGLTKRALAAKCGISEQLMGDIEAGRRNATPENLLKFAAALNCPVVVLEAKRVTAASGVTSGVNEGGETPNSAPIMASSDPQSGDFRAA